MNAEKTPMEAVDLNRLVRQGLEWMIGMEVKAAHPVTCLNPSPTFRIYDAKIDNLGKLFVRGEETMWFHGGMISLPNDKDLRPPAPDVAPREAVGGGS